MNAKVQQVFKKSLEGQRLVLQRTQNDFNFRITNKTNYRLYLQHIVPWIGAIELDRINVDLMLCVNCRLVGAEQTAEWRHECQIFPMDSHSNQG